MKQQNLLTKMLLLFALVVGSVTSVWADETKTEGFETKTAGNNYQSTITVSTEESDCGISWELYYGTVSTSNAITGSNSAALRLYTTNNYGYLKTTTAIDGLKKVSFNASAATSNNSLVKINVSYSINGTTWIALETDVTTEKSSKNYEYNIPEGGKYFQIAISPNSTKPSKKNTQLTIDDVIFTYEAAASSPLASIAVSGNYPTSFYVNDEFSHEGAVVTATYEDASTKDVSASATFSTPDMTSTEKKTVTVSYTEGEVTKTTTYDITVNARPALTSIALSGTYTTIFEQGSTFNHDGAIVTATYEDNSTRVVTNSAIFSTPDMTTVGTKTVTVSYSENEVERITSYEITVNEYVQPTTIEATFNNVFLGVSEGSRITESTTITKDNVAFIFEATGSNKHQGDADCIRSYKDTSVEIQAPNGYAVTGVTFTFGSNKKDFEVSSGSWSRIETVGTWTGLSKSVKFSNTSGRADITSVSVTITKIESITPAYEYISFSTTRGLDFTDVEGLTAFVVSTDNGTSVKLTEVKKVPANTGLVLKKTGTDADYSVPVLNGGADSFTNLLIGTADGPKEVTARTVYVLNSGQFKLFTGTTIPQGKAYLPTSNGDAPALDLDFGEGTTGIQNIERSISDDQYYTLDGRRVAQPTKGLYILNGKKVILK